MKRLVISVLALGLLSACQTTTVSATKPQTQPAPVPAPVVAAPQVAAAPAVEPAPAPKVQAPKVQAMEPAPELSPVTKLTDANFKAFVSRPGVPVVATLTASWCGPCKPFVQQMNDMGIVYWRDLEIGIGDVKDMVQTAKDLKVVAIPTLLLYRDGQVIGRRQGLEKLRDVHAYTVGALKIPRANEAIQLEDAALDRILSRADRPILFGFTAEWTPFHIEFQALLKSLARDRGDDVVVAIADIDKTKTTAERFGVKAVPTLVLHDGSKELGRHSGAMRRDAIRDWLQSNMPR